MTKLLAPTLHRSHQPSTGKWAKCLRIANKAWNGQIEWKISRCADSDWILKYSSFLWRGKVTSRNLLPYFLMLSTLIIYSHVGTNCYDLSQGCKWWKRFQGFNFQNHQGREEGWRKHPQLWHLHNPSQLEKWKSCKLLPYPPVLALQLPLIGTNPFDRFHYKARVGWLFRNFPPLMYYTVNYSNINKGTVAFQKINKRNTSH